MIHPMHIAPVRTETAWERGLRHAKEVNSFFQMPIARSCPTLHCIICYVQLVIHHHFSKAFHMYFYSFLIHHVGKKLYTNFTTKPKLEFWRTYLMYTNVTTPFGADSLAALFSSATLVALIVKLNISILAQKTGYAEKSSRTGFRSETWSAVTEPRFEWRSRHAVCWLQTSCSSESVRLYKAGDRKN